MRPLALLRRGMPDQIQDSECVDYLGLLREIMYWLRQIAR